MHVNSQHETIRRIPSLPLFQLVILLTLTAQQLPYANSLSTPSSSVSASASARSAIQAAPSAPPIRRVAVIGAGIAGLSLAHALENSDECAAKYVEAVGNAPEGQQRGGGGSSASAYGIEVSIFDSRPDLDFTAGAGIQLNGGMSVLRRINPTLHAKMVDASLPLTDIRSRAKPWFGGGKDPFSTLLEINLKDTIKKAGGETEKQLILDGQVQAYTIMRGALQEVLAEQLPEKTKGRLHFGKTLVDIQTSDDSDGGVICLFDDDSTYGPFDMVVGCDGMKSAVKEYIERGKISPNPKEREGRSAIYSGIRIKFAVQDGDDSDPNQAKSAELKQYFGDDCYGLSGVYGAGAGRPATKCSFLILRDEDYIGPFRKKKADGDDGLEATKVVAENADWTQDTQTGTREECMGLMDKAGIPQVELAPVIDKSDRFFELGVYFHNPFSLRGWSREVKGSKGVFCVLCGDAAHAMPPFLGQGSNQAIQDAYCLATKIFEHNANFEDSQHMTEASLPDSGDDSDKEKSDRSLRALLKEYERVRWSPTASITAKAALLGYLETGGGWKGSLSKFRDVFFFTLGKVGVASKVFLDAANPKV